MTTPPADANPTISSTYLMPGYDPSGNLIKVACRMTNIQTDPDSGIVYGDFCTQETGSGSIWNASDYPAGATPITADSGVVANAVVTATLLGTSGKTTYIRGFCISGSGATVGLPVTVTMTNVITGTMNYVYCASVGALIANSPLIVTFGGGIPANAQNTNIVISCPALGLGNLKNAINAWGYQV